MSPRVFTFQPLSVSARQVLMNNAGAAFDSKVENCVVGHFRPSPGPEVYSDAGSMWHSEVVASTVTLDLKFPFPVELTKIRLYSGHSQKYHPEKSFACSVPSPNGTQKTLARDEMKSFNGEVTFTATESQDLSPIDDFPFPKTFTTAFCVKRIWAYRHPKFRTLLVEGDRTHRTPNPEDLPPGGTGCAILTHPELRSFVPTRIREIPCDD